MGYNIYLMLVVLFLIFLENIIEAQDDCNVSYMLSDSYTGVLSSSNYPFNYRNSRASVRNYKCQYTFYPDPNLARYELNGSICFTFHRFNLDDSDYCASDSLEFADTDAYKYVKYCGNGHIAMTGNGEVLVTDHSIPQSVFSPNFCWPVHQDSFFMVVFMADVFNNGTGFYATYQVSFTNDHVTIDQGLGPICTATEFTCFNRLHCIPVEKMCDHVDDCGDNSDETYYHARCTTSYTQSIEACDFEGNGAFMWCFFEPNKDWSIGTKSQGSAYDHTFETFDVGHYLFTTGPNANLTYRFNTSYKQSVPLGDKCLTFWYFMYSVWANFSVYVRVANGFTKNVSDGPTWTTPGFSSAEWHYGQIDLPKDLIIDKVTFSVSQPSSIVTNIGLDDVSLHPRACWQADIACNFELGFCGWANEDLAIVQLQWLRKNGPTLTQMTGPKADHNGSPQNYYVYIESSGAIKNDRAVLTSPVVSDVQYGSNRCLVFYYHMYGDGMGSLEVYIRLYNGTDTLLWTRSGSLDNQWKTSRIVMPSLSVPFQIKFIATVGKSFTSDIAIDDIQLLNVNCYRLADPFTDPPVPSTNPPLPSCSYDQFMCSRDQICITKNWVCDGRRDCSDSSDEARCSRLHISQSTLIGMCMGLIVIALLLLVGTIIVCRHRLAVKRRHREQISRLNALHYFDPNSDDAGFMMDEGITSGQPPPYRYVVDNSALQGPPVQLPSYDSIAMPPPPYKVVIKSPTVSESEGFQESNRFILKIPAPLTGIGAATMSVSVFRVSELPPNYDVSMQSTQSSSRTSSSQNYNDPESSRASSQSASHHSSRPRDTNTRPSHRTSRRSSKRRRQLMAQRRMQESFQPETSDRLTQGDANPVRGAIESTCQEPAVQSTIEPITHFVGSDQSTKELDPYERIKSGFTNTSNISMDTVKLPDSKACSTESLSKSLNSGTAYESISESIV